jgi:flagellar biosynthesis regulator FlaF
MALTTRDVITEDFIRDTVEQVVEEDLIYRQAFRAISASDIQSNSYTFYIEQNEIGRPTIVGEGEEAPRHGAETPEEHTVQFDKYMGELVITMEAMEDGLMEMKAREVEDLARAMAEELNEEAFNAINDAVNAAGNPYTATGDSNNILSFEDIVEGMKQLQKESYEPDLLIVDIDGYTDLLTDDNFNRATDSGDELVRNGEIGRIADIPVIVDTTQELGQDGHGALMFDTDRFGYELTRSSMTTREYEEPERQAEVVQVYTRKAWTAIFEDAVIEISG